MPDIIGIENLKQHLASFKNISKLEMRARERDKHAILITTKEAPVDELVNFFQDQQQHESAKYAPRYISVFLKGANTTSENGKDAVGFTFAIDERNRAAPINGTGAPAFNESMYRVYEESGYLRAENARLINKVADLEDEIDELNEQLESNESTPGKVNGTSQIMEYMEVFEKFKNIFPAVNGAGQQNISQDMELNNAIAELQLTDPYFKVQILNYLNQIKNPSDATGNNNNKANPNAGNNGNGNGVS